MKTALRIMLPVILLLSTLTVSYGQHTMYLSTPTTATYLNDIIVGDTTATGERQDTERVYVLQRGGTWFWNNTVTNNGWAINIQAEDGTGDRPKVYSMPTPGTTSVPYNLVSVAGDVIVKNCMFSGHYDEDSTFINTYGATYILFRGETAGNFRIELVGNLFMNTQQAIASTFSAIHAAIFKDNVIINDGIAQLAGAGNGRVIDTRNVSIDSLIFINNTVMYGFDRVVRHKSSVGRLNNFVFDHNTVYEHGGRYGFLALGAVGNKVQITNNLLVDPMASGCDTNSQRQSDFKEMNEFDANGKVKMAWIYHAPVTSDTLGGVSVNTEWKISNNYWHITPEMAAMYATCISNGWNPTIATVRTLSESIKSKIDTTKAFYNLDDFSFTKVPAPFDGTMLWLTKPTSEGGTNGGSSGGTFVPYETYPMSYFGAGTSNLNCAYSTSSAAYTGAENSLPAGDLNWFPSKKTDWENNTDVNEFSVIPSAFSLEQNYPNPFNPTTKITYSIPKESKVSLEVFNVLGQKVATLVNNSQAAGSYSVNFNASKLSSGLYIYRLVTSEFTTSRKMMLMK